MQLMPTHCCGTGADAAGGIDEGGGPADLQAQHKQVS